MGDGWLLGNPSFVAPIGTRLPTQSLIYPSVDQCQEVPFGMDIHKCIQVEMHDRSTTVVRLPTWDLVLVPTSLRRFESRSCQREGLSEPKRRRQAQR